MAASKAALKAIKSSIDAGDFAKASVQAHEALKEDASNQNALMFLGFVEEKLHHYDSAENALQKASAQKPGDVQPLKGLIRLYEQQDSKKLEQYYQTAFSLASIYAEQEDREQCQNVIDKYELFVKKHGTRSQYRQGLQLMLPSCPLYQNLEGRIPHPSHIYQRILESSQSEESEWISNQIAERRTRLGAKLDKVTVEVKNEAVSKFRIIENYQNLIDWTQDDDIRHTLDQELLQRLLDVLTAAPKEEKIFWRDRVLEKANGMVVIGQQFELAWNLALEWVDSERLADWDDVILYRYIEYFPDSGLGKVLRGMLYGACSPFPPPKPVAGEPEPEKLSETDTLITMSEGLEEAKESVLANRIMAYTYLELNEHQSAAEYARISERLYRHIVSKYAQPMQDSLDAVNLILGRAYVIYQSPKNHPEARKLFEDIIARKPQLTEALLGVGLIYEEDEDYTQAVSYLGQALQRDPNNLRIHLEHAWCRALDRDLQGGLSDLETVKDRIQELKTSDNNMQAEVLYRIAYCKWHLDSSTKARKDKSGPYRYLIESLKSNPSYAPAYTLLGFYFQDYAKNQPRARVAFQKAFELSTSELSAAEQLAENFADRAEWDLVELVAQRVVDSGKTRPAPGSKKKAYSWPYAALGTVQMSRSQYSLSIVSFQHALRISPNNYHAWVGLGESYHNSGRYVAASRAFNKAESIDHGLSPEESWFAKYMLANVQRELGAYDEAIRAYHDVLQIKPDELGMLLSLLQTFVDYGRSSIRQGHFGRAAELATEALRIAKKIKEQDMVVFNLWKAIGDACSLLYEARALVFNFDLELLRSVVDTRSYDGDKSMANGVDHADEAADLAAEFLSGMAIAFKFAVDSCAGDVHSQAVAYYNLGWAEYTRYSRQANLSGKKESKSLIKAAVRSFKQAIELESGNSDFWNALGIATFSVSPKISQHAFIRALHLNDASARTWTNLGALYIDNNDHELANEAFTRAQSADPEYAEAWVGQGVIAMLTGNIAEARALFKHAFETADSSCVPAKRFYASTAFDALLQSSNLSSNPTALLQPVFAARQLSTQEPADTTSQHLLSLLLERVQEYENAEASFKQVCDATESIYESSESNEALARAAQAKADYARQLLIGHKYDLAIEAAQFALDISEEDNLGSGYTTQRAKWRLSAQLTIGLAKSSSKDNADAVKSLQTALTTSTSLSKEGYMDADIVCLLAQVLWSIGGEKEREAARNQLFDLIEREPDHVGAAMILAVVTMLDGDEETLAVAEEDLKGMRSATEVSIEQKLKIGKILSAILHMKGGDQQTHDVQRFAQDSIMLNPDQPQGWVELAKTEKGPEIAEIAVRVASKQIPPDGNLNAEDLAGTYMLSREKRSLKQAVMLAPWLS